MQPSAFIEALAQHSVARDLGRWVLTSACEAAAGWQQRGYGPIRVGVNLFPVQLYDSELAHDLEDALLRAGLAPELFELEIPESITLRGDDGVIQLLQRIRHSGVKLAFDDFGTGYASLTALRRYPVSRLKIDQSFVHGLTNDPANRAIVRSSIVLAHSLGLEAIAEGVETEEEADLLKSERCDEVQGFWYGKPMAIHNFEAFLLSRAGSCISVAGAGQA